LFSNFSASLTENFLGSKDPTPAAIIILGAKKIFLPLVVILQLLPSFVIS